MTTQNPGSQSQDMPVPGTRIGPYDLFVFHDGNAWGFVVKHGDEEIHDSFGCDTEAEAREEGEGAVRAFIEEDDLEG